MVNNNITAGALTEHIAGSTPDSGFAPHHPRIETYTSGAIEATFLRYNPPPDPPKLGLYIILNERMVSHISMRSFTSYLKIKLS